MNKHIARAIVGVSVSGLVCALVGCGTGNITVIWCGIGALTGTMILSAVEVFTRFHVLPTDGEIRGRRR